MMNRHLRATCLAALCVALFLTLTPAPAMAKIVPDKDLDFSCALKILGYTDQTGKTVNTDFSAIEDGLLFSPTAEIDYDRELVFDFGDVIYLDDDRQGGEWPDHPYKIVADNESSPAACLAWYEESFQWVGDTTGFKENTYETGEAINGATPITTNVAVMGIDRTLGNFAWFPLVLGPSKSNNVDFRVTLGNFQGTGKAQTGYNVSLVADGCIFTAIWFTGSRPDGNKYTNALIFNGSIVDTEGNIQPVYDDDGTPKEVIITGLNPKTTKLFMSLMIGSDYNSSGNLVAGARFSANYVINDNEYYGTLFDGSTLQIRQVTGYDGTGYIEGFSSPGDFRFPFINMYTTYYPSTYEELRGKVYDEHVGGACFVDSTRGRASLVPDVKDGPAQWIDSLLQGHGQGPGTTPF